jgi:20S proteasome alpha/beta subunit
VAYIIKYSDQLEQFGMLKRVTVAANVLAGLVQSSKEQLSTAFIIGGWDEDGPHVFDISLSGLLIERKLATTGSGSVYVSAYIDENYRDDFTMEEATEFAVKAVALVISRDGACGGPINVVQITESGAKSRTVRPASHPVDDRIVKT